MEWKTEALESLVSAFAPRRGGAARGDGVPAAAPLDLVAHRRRAAERRDLEAYLEIVRKSARMKRRGIALRARCEVVAFRRRA